MNAVDYAQRAYGANATPVRTPRNTEYALFARITQKLRAAAEDSGKFNELAHALHENKRLWRTLAVDVADENNSLPELLRGQIFYLSEFVTHHSSKVLRGQASAGPLVDINMAIMRGLGGEGRA
ncbi:MAG: flagellar biosynthesis regulator FlaF [Tropicimonas sp.]|uniref:flagellar biosynthesis regulator FlaF n=1 Tax=Tropicimonas sp. TaxID=2067044 RepID=UPI003A850E44